MVNIALLLLTAVGGLVAAAIIVVVITSIALVCIKQKGTFLSKYI